MDFTVRLLSVTLGTMRLKIQMNVTIGVYFGSN